MVPAVGRPRGPRIALAAALGIVAILAVGFAARLGLDAYRNSLTLTGLSADPSLVALTVAGEQLTIPGNMLRDPAVRKGGAVAEADLLLHWPNLEGYSKPLAADFADGSPDAPLIYASIAARTVPLDATELLVGVYQEFFVGDPLPAPDGLTGRQLSPNSGYDGEVVYYGPDGPQQFVARCLAEATPETPATCLRTINIGKNLALLYRFNRDRIGDWQALDAGMQTLAVKIVAAD